MIVIYLINIYFLLYINNKSKIFDETEGSMPISPITLHITIHRPWNNLCNGYFSQALRPCCLFTNGAGVHYGRIGSWNGHNQQNIEH